MKLPEPPDYLAVSFNELLQIRTTRGTFAVGEKGRRKHQMTEYIKCLTDEQLQFLIDDFGGLAKQGYKCTPSLVGEAYHSNQRILTALTQEYEHRHQARADDEAVASFFDHITELNAE